MFFKVRYRGKRYTGCWNDNSPINLDGRLIQIYSDKDEFGGNAAIHLHPDKFRHAYNIREASCTVFMGNKIGGKIL